MSDESKRAEVLLTLLICDDDELWVLRGALENARKIMSEGTDAEVNYPRALKAINGLQTKIGRNPP